MPASPPEPAGLLYAHYEVLRDADGSPQLLGSGGMGMTYKARDTRLDLPVALKLIHPLHVSHPQAQRLFLREARAAARVIHANVAPVVYLHDEPGKFFYAMEFVDGAPLDVYLRKNGPLPAGRALAFAEQVARGLGAIHEQGLIHRDLKPANVMVTCFPSGHPRHRALATSGGCALKIIDFGLARSITPSDDLPTIGFRGTAAFASPEQCEERSDLDARSDLYALGCITWHLLAGQPPFTGRSQMEITRQHCEAPPPWDMLPGLDPAVGTVLRCLLAKDRDERPPDAIHAAEMLAEARASLPWHTPAPASGTTEWATTTMSPRPGSSNTATMGAAGTPPLTPRSALPRSPATVAIPVTRLRWAITFLVLLLVATVGGIWWSTRRPPTPAPPPPAAPAGARVVAVLPFENLSGDQGSDFLADGIHEDVLTAMAKVRELRVVARSSVRKYRGRSDAARQAAQDLGAALVIEGGVSRSAGRVRVTARLIDAASGQQVWADSYEREITDLFEIQATMATEIASALALNFSRGGRAIIMRRPTANRDAYEAFLRARFLQGYGEPSPEEGAKIIALYGEAVRLDPEFARAWARLSLAHMQRYWLGRDRTPARLAQARAAAERAVQLQPELPDARLALGDLRYRGERDWEGALGEYRVALAIEPSNANAREAIALSLRRLGRWDESLRESRLAVELAAEDTQKILLLGAILWQVRRYAEAERWYRRAHELTGNTRMEAVVNACRLMQTGDWERHTHGLRELLPRLAAGEVRARAFIDLRDFPAAIRELRAVPGPDLFGYTLNVAFPKELGIALLLRSDGQADEARRQFSEAARLLAERVESHPGDVALRMKWALALAGHQNAEAALRESEEALRQLPPSRDAVEGCNLLADRAQILGMLGRAEEACVVLEQLLAVPGDLARVWLRHSPVWDDLRGHPRFEKLLVEP